jgi:hypothetical protein
MKATNKDMNLSVVTPGISSNDFPNAHLMHYCGCNTLNENGVMASYYFCPKILKGICAIHWSDFVTEATIWEYLLPA